MNHKGEYWRAGTALLLACVVPACGFFDPNLWMMSDAGGAEGGVDAGPIDSGPSGPAMVDRCGADEVFVIRTTTTGMRVDTTLLGGLYTPNCSGHAALGNDGFFALDVVEGEYWHLHLQPDPSEPGFSGRDPSLYLLTSGCDERRCDASSDSCSGTGGEHFAFVATSPGRWYVGIDDRNPGGGHYLLDVIRPECGANGAEHGESCDDGNLDDGDGCDRLCRSEITEGSRSERIPNNTPVEANVLRMPASNELIVSGDIGGDDCFPDYFALTVPDGASLDVTALDVSELPCIDDTTARFDMNLLNADLTLAGTPDRRDINGCPIIQQTGLRTGEYLIRLTGAPESAELYRIQVVITP